MNTLPNDLRLLLSRHYDCVDASFLSTSEYNPVKWVMYFLRKKDYKSLKHICSRYDRRLVNVCRYIVSYLSKKIPEETISAIRLQYVYIDFTRALEHGDSGAVYDLYKGNEQLGSIFKKLTIALRNNDLKMYGFIVKVNDLSKNKIFKLFTLAVKNQYDKFKVHLDYLIKKNEIPWNIKDCMEYVALLPNGFRYLKYWLKKYEGCSVDDIIMKAMLNNVDIDIINLLVKTSSKSIALRFAYLTGYMPFYKKMLVENPLEVQKLDICWFNKYEYMTNVKIEMLVDLFEHYPPSVREIHSLINTSKKSGRYDLFVYLSNLLPN